MGTIAARQCREILDNSEHVLAVELLCAAQALDLLRADKGLRPGAGTHRAWQTIRQKVPFMSEDRIMAKDIQSLLRLLRSGEIVQAVEDAVGPLR
jgi:histidine ammonia-lyase